MPRVRVAEGGNQGRSRRRSNKRYNAKAYAYLRICNGWERKDIIDSIVEHYGYAEGTAGNICDQAAAQYGQHIMHDTEKIMNKNMQRLEAIIDASLDNEDSTTMLKAMDMENKVCGVYETKVSVKGEGDTPIFKIKIDE